MKGFKKKFTFMLLAMCLMLTSVTNVAFAAEVTPTPEQQLMDNSATLVDLLRSVGSLFGTYPINLFLAAGIISLVFGIFRKAKNAAR